MKAPAKSITESGMLDALAALGPVFGPHVVIEVDADRRRTGDRRKSPDVIVRVRWQGVEFEFAAQAKAQSTPRALEDTLRQARGFSSQTGKLPMVILPFLSDQRIDRLMQEGVSGLDLCGNGLVMVPGRLMLRSTGRPNQYPESRPTRFAYRGTTSLVPRAFLRRSDYESVGQIQEEVRAGGGLVALSTVSKALKRMADDFVIDRSDGRIRLVQADKLLDLLAESFVTPRPVRVMSARLSGSLPELFASIKTNSDARLILSGASAQDRYAAGMRSDLATLYSGDLDLIRGACRPVERFADITVIETSDPTPFFDARTDEFGVIYASPVQSYLELFAAGEKRDREMAKQVREGLLKGLGR